MQFWRQWAPYVPVARRRANALRKMDKLRKKGKAIQPVAIAGRTIARSFWGKGWCEHIESFSDFDNRLPRGRTYVRNGSVCHLAMQASKIEAIVSGSELYNIKVRVQKLKPTRWDAIKKNCAGHIGSMLELLQGRLSDQVMGVVTDRTDGLFPQFDEIEFKCDCPDWAVMCKHVAAVLYGVGARLDHQPELLFLLRGVDAQELIAADLAMPATAGNEDVIDADRLGDVFNIELEAPIDSKKRRKPKRSSVRPKTTASHRQPSRKSNISKRPPEAVPQKIRLRPTGRSIARLRKKLKLSAAEFAQKLKVSTTTVYRWEKVAGRVPLRPPTLAAFAELDKRAKAGKK